MAVNLMEMRCRDWDFEEQKLAARPILISVAHPSSILSSSSLALLSALPLCTHG